MLMAGKYGATMRAQSAICSRPAVNLILFSAEEISRPLPRTDPRAQHLLDVLQRRPGDTFDAGLRDGPRGKGTLIAVSSSDLTLEFQWGDPPPPLDNLTLIIGLPRPQTARKILREATALGLARLHFVVTGRGEAAYAQSTLWTSGEWERQLVIGAEQAFCTRLPVLTHGHTLAEILTTIPSPGARLALDNYEAPQALSQFHLLSEMSVVLAFGSERGWTAAERDRLRAAQFAFVHLGSRVLRVETAVVAAIAIVKARRGAM
jgi:16S rRNA (uracil1498-N3)-methyltransferase